MAISVLSLILTVLQPAMTVYAAKLYDNEKVTLSLKNIEGLTPDMVNNNSSFMPLYEVTVLSDHAVILKVYYISDDKVSNIGAKGSYLFAIDWTSREDVGENEVECWDVFSAEDIKEFAASSYKRSGDRFIEYISDGVLWDTTNTGLVVNRSKSDKNSYNHQNIAELLESEVKSSSGLDTIEVLLRLMVDEYTTAQSIADALDGTNEVVIAKTSNDDEGSVLMLERSPAQEGDESAEDEYIIKYKYTEKGTEFEEVVPMPSFTNMLFDESVQIDSDKYKAVSNLHKVFKELQKSISEKNDGETDNTITEEIKQFNNKTTFEKWSLTISNYVKTNGAEKAISSLTEELQSQYNLDAFTSDGLTPEEVMRLKSFFYLTTTKAGKSVPEIPALAYPESGEQVEINASGYQLNDVKDAAELAIKNNNNSNSVATTMGKIALNFDSVAKYGLAKVYGYAEANPFDPNDQTTQTPEDGTSNGEVDGVDDSVLSRSDYLSSLLPNTDEVLPGSLDYSIVLPKIEKAQYVAGTESAYDSYLQMQYSLIAVASYARFNSYIDDSTMRNETLDDFLNLNTGKEESAEVPDNLKNVINAYMSIHRGLEYLGITPFTKYLEAVDSYYNSLLPYENNAGLKEPYDKDTIPGAPMRSFFNLDSKQFENSYLKGVALSASYIPMQTNLYDVTSVAPLNDPDFVEQFHYPFGFYRKALYIDTNINAAVDGHVRSKRSGETRIATLNDLLEPEKDIVLYVDPNFYNVNKLAEMQGFAYRKMANTEEAGKASADGNAVTTFLTDAWSEFFNTNIENIAKTSGVRTYSENVKREVSEYDVGKDKEKGSDYVLSSKNIEKYLTGYSAEQGVDVYDEYTPLQSFAVTSAIYRDSKLFNVVKGQISENKPVFISSSNLAGVDGITQEEWNTIYNYAMLKNLKANLGIDYKTTLDLGSPLYIDIYGNILTESGLVVIPAASNSTLYNPTSYRPYSIGFMSLYGKEWSIPADYKNSSKFMESVFYIEEETNTWQVKNKQIGDIYMLFRDLPVNDADIMSSLILLEKQHLDKGCLDFSPRVYLITEVLRGAPIENIDKDFEGITGNRSINKYGMYMAYKLDELSEQLLSNTNGNSMITLPNLAYIDGVEYVILFLFKILFAVTLALLAYKIYTDAVQGFLGIKTFTTFISTLVIFVVVAFSIPKLMDASYYQINKRLLQDEMEYVALLNLEKANDGKEIGITSVDVPETQTTLYVKLDSLSVPWYEVLDDVLLSNAFDTVDDIYQSAFEENLMSTLPGIIKKSNGLYMDLNYLFDTSTIEYDNKTNSIHQYVLETPYASYTLPYYAVLDTLIARVNSYNVKNEITSADTKIQSNGAIKTTNLIEQYFTSEEFMEFSQDILGFKYIYGVPTTFVEYTPFSDEELTAMQGSLWYSADYDSDLSKIEEKVDRLDYKARSFVAKNRDLFGKVSDETFLKIMALSMSLEHNNEFGVPAARSIEIFDVDSKDIIRLSMASRSVTMQGTSKSFARFVYDNAGTLGVVATAMLIAVYFVSSLVKPVCMLIILASMIASLIIRKLVKRDGDKAIEGFLVTMALLCLTNVVYAVMLKVSLSLPELGLTPVVSIVLQILIQFVYFFIISVLTVWVLRDWRSMGFNKYQNVFGGMTIRAAGTANLFAANMMYNNTAQQHYYEQYRRRNNYRRAKKTRGITGNTIYQRLRKNDEKRYRRRR